MTSPDAAMRNRRIGETMSSTVRELGIESRKHCVVRTVGQGEASVADAFVKMSLPRPCRWAPLNMIQNAARGGALEGYLIKDR